MPPRQMPTATLISLTPDTLRRCYFAFFAALYARCCHCRRATRHMPMPLNIAASPLIVARHAGDARYYCYRCLLLCYHVEYGE